MARYIDADELLKHIPCEDIGSRFAVAYAPTEDVEPVKHGKWVSHIAEAGYRCSNCQKRWIILIDEQIFKYCPNCGAKMDKENKDENINE